MPETVTITLPEGITHHQCFVFLETLKRRSNTLPPKVVGADFWPVYHAIAKGLVAAASETNAKEVLEAALTVSAEEEQNARRGLAAQV